MAEDTSRKSDADALRSRFGVVLERRKQTEGITTETADHRTKNKNLQKIQNVKISKKKQKKKKRKTERNPKSQNTKKLP